MSIEPIPSIGSGRCGCASDECSCLVVSSNSVIVVGDGSVLDPYLFEIDNAEIHLSVVDSATVNLTLTGLGTPEDPYHISGTASPAAVDIDEFTADGVYNVPTTASMLLLLLVGQGGGGGGGETTATGGRGGGGGQGGAVTEFLIPTSQVGPTLTIDFDAGGGGGNGAASGGGSGTNGTAGGRVRVLDGGDTIAVANGGAGGQAGGNGGDGGDADQSGTIRGGRGANAEVSGTQSNAPNGCMFASGGGVGASYTAASVVIAATDGGDPLCRGTNGGAAGSPGAIGEAFAGGGGGAPGQNGGDGGNYGGGGGGGGAQITGAGAAGNGGDGASGLVRIMAW